MPQDKPKDKPIVKVRGRVMARKSGGKASRDKGVAGEREFAAFVREAWPGAGEAVRSGNQYRGGEIAPDITGVAGWWIEVKRKRLDASQMKNLIKATSDSRDSGCKPVVAHRKDYDERWMVTLWAKDFTDLLTELHYLQEECRG